MEIVNDNLCLERMKRHADFHKFALIQKRNTTHGIPKYLIISKWEASEMINMLQSQKK
jgi:hypothetical protein